MRTMLLSLKPEVFTNVQSGVKIYEHRRVFPDEPVKAYIYVSRPVQALSGVMYLGNKTDIEDWKEKYDTHAAFASGLISLAKTVSNPVFATFTQSPFSSTIQLG